MIRRKDITQGLLPEVPTRALAFAYRPYVTAAVGATRHSNSLLLDPLRAPSPDSDSDSDCSTTPNARIVGDRQVMAQMHAQAVLARVREAKRLVDDERFEYACDVVLECQRGFNFLGKANFSTKLLHPMDPPPWCDAQMELTLPNVHSFQLPDPSWQWVSPRWLIDMTQDVDEDGWQYASRFSASATWHGRHSAQGFVRRRRWLRLRRRSKCHYDEESDDLCFNSAVNEVGRSEGGAQPIIKAAASKIKSKVSGNYVGSSPRSPTSPTAKALAYTLKDGKYRSHCLKSPPAIPPHLSPSRPLVERPLVRDGCIPGTAIPHNAVSAQPSLHSSSTGGSTQKHFALLRRQVSASSWPIAQEGGSGASAVQGHHHKCRHHGSSTHDAEPLPLPTGGFVSARPLPNDLLSAAASVVGTEYSDNAGEPIVAEYNKSFPRLVALAPPETTVPLDQFQRSLSSPLSLPGKRVIRSQTSPQPLLSPATVVAKSQVSGDEDAGSTVVASRTDIREVDRSLFDLRRKMSASSSLSSSPRLQIPRPRSSLSSIEYLDNDLPQLDPYVDPYMSLQLPTTILAGASDPIDERLIKLATVSLKQMLEDVRLDRERLDILRSGLAVGGITAATIWYSLRWLHFDLMQYDAGRQQLIAMLLSFSHTCPMDLVAGCEEVTPSVVWRLVVRPVIAGDLDLFYSDFKLMVVGVARWNLQMNL
ncbi:hypothetical protein GGH94_004404 [Coemansia aciculifera]|uniref:Peroxin/Ferlin domain-containing protein n=1 Tax=Coemansia aciculifera TaxID=417176 RepID=A0A9W8M5A1_9FUNG|nr:hypothetical protein GGH94_004404 [Coemansia aciculifera]KAJ2871965.1 hypothetical protein GGH93_004397 [Coemansia aciculifera]